MVISLPEQFLVGGAALEPGQHTAGHYALPHLPHTECSELFAQRSGVRFERVCPQAGQAAVCLVGEDVPCFVRVVLVQEFCHIPPGRAQHHQALYVIPEHCRVQIIGTGAAQHSVDQTGCTGFFKAPGQLDRLIDGSRHRHLHIAGLCQRSTQDLAHRGIQLCQTLGQKLFQNIVQCAPVFQHCVKNGTGKGLVAAFQLLALEFGVQDQVGKAVLLLPHQRGDRCRPRIGRHQRTSPVFRRRPAAKEVPSMGFLPSGTTCSSWMPPSAQATVRGFVASTVPGASP